MKAKKLVFFTAAFFCASVLAKNEKLQFVYGTEVSPKLSPMETVGHVESPLKGAMAKQIRPVSILSPQNSELQFVKKTLDKDTWQLDSIVSKKPDGSNEAIWYSTYNNLGKETQRWIRYWNPQKGEWDQPSEEYTYIWTDDGLILSEQVVGYGAGQRIDYVYDNQGRGIEQIQYALGENGSWSKTTKGIYTYDEEDNIIEEYVYVWDGARWIDHIHNTASWDSKKRQTGFAGYSWDGVKWVGTEKYEYIWFDGPRDPDYIEGTSSDRMIYKSSYYWIDGEWVHYYIFTNSINDEGRLIGQSEKFYNRAFKKWSGGDNWDGRLGYYTSWEGIHTLDSHGNQVLSKTYTCLPDSSRWIEPGIGIFDWEYSADGSRVGLYKFIRNVYDEAYNKTGEILDQQVYYAYNADNKKTWLLQQIASENGDLENLFEEKYGYDERGLLTYSAVWDWVNAVRTPTTYTQNVYNENGELIEIVTKGSAGMSPIGLAAKNNSPELEPEDEMGWVNTSRWIIEYENGYQIAKKGYLWKNETWTPNSGESVDYDWNYPASEIIVPNGWYDPFKINIIYTYMADGSGNWVQYVRDYYYSAYNASSLNPVERNNDIRILPTLVTDFFQVITSRDVDIRVYSSSGKQVIRTSDKEVFVSDLCPGIYFVNINGTVTKKIIKK